MNINCVFNRVTRGNVYVAVVYTFVCKLLLTVLIANMLTLAKTGSSPHSVIYTVLVVHTRADTLGGKT